MYGASAAEYSAPQCTEKYIRIFCCLIIFWEDVIMSLMNKLILTLNDPHDDDVFLYSVSRSWIDEKIIL